MKKAGNALMALVGGREVHPINVRVGGFYRVPSPSELRRPVRPARRARERPHWRRSAGRPTLPFPEVERSPELLALADPERLPDRPRADPSPTGGDFAPAQFDDARRGGARRALQRAARPHARARHLPHGSAGALRPGGLEAATAGPGGGARGGPAGASAATPSRASSCARSSWSRRATKRSR